MSQAVVAASSAAGSGGAASPSSSSSSELCSLCCKAIQGSLAAHADACFSHMQSQFTSNLPLIHGKGRDQTRAALLASQQAPAAGATAVAVRQPQPLTSASANTQPVARSRQPQALLAQPHCASVESSCSSSWASVTIYQALRICSRRISAQLSMRNLILCALCVSRCRST